MKKIAALLALVQLLLMGSPALAQTYQVAEWQAGPRSVVTERWVEEWDPIAARWVRVEEDAAPLDRAGYQPTASQAVDQTSVQWVRPDRVAASRAATRYSKPAALHGSERLLARYGPFIVTSTTRAAMIGPTDTSSPRYFDAMLRDFPDLAVLELVEAPGTSNDIANLAVGRRIRAAGIATHVPRRGSVRSGAVELFLAGSQRTIEDGAQFAVHSWLDNHGREADDFAANDPAHRLYLDYYVEMGMSEQRARDFYAMTNSVPHASALWLVADDMRYWLRPDHGKGSVAVQSRTRLANGAGVISAKGAVAIAYADLSGIALAQLAHTRIELAQLDSRAAFP